MNRTSLLARAVRLGLPTGILLVAVGGAVLTPRTSAAQYPLEAPGNNVVPVPGATPQAARMRGQVPCEQIISSLNRNTRPLTGRASTVETEKEREATVAMIAKRNGTTQLWVAQCMRAYGRRVPMNLENVQNEDVVEQFEDQEPEESAAEDLSEPGARERDLVADENSQDRQRIRADNANESAPEKERVLRLRPDSSREPTPLFVP